MSTYTKTQAQEQQVRFDSFISSADLVKVGTRYFTIMGKDAKDGMYTPYVYIHRVLRIVAKVHGAMYHPAQMEFYSDILTRKALDASLTSLIK